MNDKTNRAVPVWAAIHNVAMWSSGYLFANGSHVWATVLVAFGIWSLIWMIGLMNLPNDQQKGLER